MAVGQQHGGGEPALAERAGSRTFGVTSGASAKPASVGPPSTAGARAGLGERSGARRRAARRSTACAAGLVGRAPRAEPSPGPAPSVHRQTCCTVASSIGLAMNVTAPARPATTERTCRSAGVTGLAVDEQPAGAVAVGGRHQRAVGQLGGHAGHELDPGCRRSSHSATSWRRSPGRPRAPRATAGRGDCTVSRRRPGWPSARRRGTGTCWRSHSTSTSARPRSRRTTCSVTSALSVPAAG